MKAKRVQQMRAMEKNRRRGREGWSRRGLHPLQLQSQMNKIKMPEMKLGKTKGRLEQQERASTFDHRMTRKKGKRRRRIENRWM